MKRSQTESLFSDGNAKKFCQGKRISLRVVYDTRDGKRLSDYESKRVESHLYYAQVYLTDDIAYPIGACYFDNLVEIVQLMKGFVDYGVGYSIVELYYDGLSDGTNLKLYEGTGRGVDHRVIVAKSLNDAYLRGEMCAVSEGTFETTVLSRQQFARKCNEKVFQREYIKKRKDLDLYTRSIDGWTNILEQRKREFVNIATEENRKSVRRAERTIEKARKNAAITKADLKAFLGANPVNAELFSKAYQCDVDRPTKQFFCANCNDNIFKKDGHVKYSDATSEKEQVIEYTCSM